MPKVTIYTDIWDADGIPHTFLRLTNSNGVEKRVGFAPRRTGLLGSGFVGDNSTHEYQHSYEIEISQEQYDNLDNAIKKSEMEPPYYNLPLGIQCTAWAMSMLQEAGIVDQPIAPDIDPKEFYGNFYGDIMGENFGRPFGEFIGDFAGYLQTIIYNPYMQRFGFALKDYGSNINDFLFPFLSPTVYDPITLDLNKDGKIDTTGLNNGVYFDHNGDKVAMKTSWVSKEDGLLVRDRNNNGIIDDGSELFGNFTPLNPNNNPSDRNLAVNGYHALKSYDMNNDGVIDSNDEIYKHLKVWQDVNQDGISQKNELKSLEQVNIKSLNLAFNNIDKDLDNGNNVMFEGNYTDNEGKEYKMADINFNVDTLSSKHKDDITLNHEQANQINLKGSGNLKDLNQAAVLSSTLNDILNSYKQANTKEEQLSLLPNLIQEWARTSVGYTQYEHSLSSVTYFDESTPQGKLAVLRQRYVEATSETQKAVIRQEMVNIENKLAETDHQQALKEINQDKELINIMQQSGGKLPSVYTPKNRTTQLRPSELNDLKQGLKDKNLLTEFEKIKYKIGVIDAFTGKQTDQLYYANDDDVKDIIQKVNKTYYDILKYAYNALNIQTRLKDYISLMDIKAEETKDDSGNIKYKFSIDYSKVADKFKEVAKVNPKKAFMDIGEFIHTFNTNANSKDIIPLAEVFGDVIGYTSKNNMLEEWKGILGVYHSTMHLVKVSEKGDTINGNKGNDVLYGGEGNDVLWGNEGNDILYGNEGNDNLIGNEGDDILEGGKGDDILQGREGDDIYVFNKGDGNDTIYDEQGNNIVKFGEGISKEDLIVKRGGDADDLVIGFKNSNTDSLTIDDVYQGGATRRHGLETIKFKFQDGTILNVEDLENLYRAGSQGNDDIRGLNDVDDVIKGLGGNDTIQGFGGNDTLYGNEGNDYLYGGDGEDTLYGGEGNDVLWGNEGNDILYGNEGNDNLIGNEGDDILEGGKGDDTIQGWEGNDTYVFGKGDGNDTVYADGKDTIKFKEGIGKNDVTFRRDGSWGRDLLIKFKTSNDSITVKNMFSENNNSEGIDKIEFADGSSLNVEDIKKRVLVGNDTNNMIIYGFDSDDILKGNAGDDTLLGGNGNDTLYGEKGNDRLYGDKGNDTLYGNEDNDELYGDDGDDTLIGGEGNDVLYGGKGNDTYIFGRGDGVDTISDYPDIEGETNTLLFKEGITKDDISIKRITATGYGNSEYWIEISIKGTDDKVRISNMFFRETDDRYGKNSISRIKFSDGTTLGLNDIKKMILAGSDADDRLEGFADNDIITGNDGNDYISGMSGNDTIYGGNGKDRLNGNDGDDTLYGGNHNDALYGGKGNDILYGDKGNDELYGDDGDDTLIGGEGNDYLYGEEGDDTYVFSKGDGNDIINDSKGNNIVKFGEGISKGDITFMYSGGNLSIKYGNSDTITVSYYVSNATYQIDKIELGNGNFITNSQINKIIQDINAYAKDNGITGISHDTIRNNQDMMNLVMSGWNS